MASWRNRWVGVVACTLVVTCGDEDTGRDDDGSTTSGAGGSAGGGGSGGAGGAGGVAPFALTSPAFAEGDTIPLAHECGPPAPVMGNGGNLTPQLEWTAGPPGTASYALVVRDIDAQIPQFPEGIIHWVIYDIPASAGGLPEGVAPGYQPAEPAGAKQAEIQGSGFFGYFGPCSPNSVNTYVFTLHAMGSAALPNVTMQSSESDVAAAIESSSIATASLSGES
jgi:hypothetical protein